MLNALKQYLLGRLDREGFTYRCLRAVHHPGEASRALRMRITKNSIFTAETELDGCSLLPEALLHAVVETFKPRSVLDLGCGMGRPLDFFLSHGVDTQGVEGSALAISRARHPDRILQWDLNRELDLHRRFDLIWCFEVAEHIHPSCVHSLMRTIESHSDSIILSAAHPGQGGLGHFNEQPRRYWIELFAEYGYRHNDALKSQVCKDWTWYPENIFVFQGSKGSLE